MKNDKTIFSTILIFYSVFFSPVGINPTLIGQTKNFALILFVIYNWRMVYMFFSHKYRIVNLCLFLFCCTILYSGWINQSTVSNITFDSYNLNVKFTKSVRFDHQVYLVLKIVSFTLFIELLIQIRNLRSFLKCLFCCFFIWGLFVNLDGFINYHKDGDGYLVGNKFDVTYYNLYVIVLYALNYSLRDPRFKKQCLLLILVSILLCYRLHCMTSLLACIFLCYLLFSSDDIKRFFCKKKTFIVFFVITGTIFFFFSDFVLNNELSKIFLVDFLGRDQTLTSRTNIYLRVGTVITSSPLWGYGMGNFYSVCVAIIGAPNAQNGIANLMVEIGIVGVAAFISLQYFLFEKKSDYLCCFPIVAYIYVMCLVASVEIPYNINYFCFSTLLLLPPTHMSKRYLCKI